MLARRAAGEGVQSYFCSPPRDERIRAGALAESQFGVLPLPECFLSTYVFNIHSVYVELLCVKHAYAWLVCHG
jgi:hypothetical protein